MRTFKAAWRVYAIAMLAIGVFIPAANAALPGKADDGQAANHTALWWNPAESGWGLNINQQGDTIFATLFTYDASGNPLWLFMSGGTRQSDGSFSGDLYQSTGPQFSAEPFTPITTANVTKVGSMALTFAGSTSATVTYTVNGVAVTKQVQPQVFGSAAANCTPTTGARNALTNYQDLWWNPAESGWGVNITHQDDILFATLFTYDGSGKPLWLVMSAGRKQPDGSYSGDLYRTTGPAFNAQPFLPIGEDNLTKVGTMSFRFTDGVTGTMTYSVNTVTVVKAITRQVFSSPVPACTSQAPTPTVPTVGVPEMCQVSDFLFSTTCDPVAVPYSSNTVMNASIFGASTITLSTFTLTARGGSITINGVTAVDDYHVTSPFVSGFSAGRHLADGESVTFSFVSPLTHGRQANVHFIVFVNGTTALDARYLLQTN